MAARVTKGSVTADNVHTLVGAIRETVGDHPRFFLENALGSYLGMTLVVGSADGRKLVVTVVPDMTVDLDRVAERVADHPGQAAAGAS